MKNTTAEYKECPRCKSPEIGRKPITYDCYECGSTWNSERSNAQHNQTLDEAIEEVKDRLHPHKLGLQTIDQAYGANVMLRKVIDLLQTLKK